MFTSIKISNYKSCKLVDFGRIGSVVVLVGRNGAGKSNILSAIQWASSGAASNSLLDLSSPHLIHELEPPRIEFEIRVGSTDFRYTLQINSNLHPQKRPRELPEDWNEIAVFLEESVSVSADGRWQKVVSRENHKIEIVGREARLQVGSLTPCLSALTTFLPPDDEIVVTTAPLISFLRQVRYYHFDEPTIPENNSPVISNAEYKAWLKNYELTSDPGSSALMRILHMKLAAKDRFEEFESLIGPNGIELLKKIYHSPLVPSFPRTEGASNPGEVDARWHQLLFQPGKASDRMSSLFYFPDLSLGTRRVIRILASMVFDRSSVMLIEQPEDGIHPGLTKKVIGLLRDYADPLQLFISSHSLSVFNTLSVEDVRFVTMVDGETKLRGLTHTEIEAARKFISEEGDMADVIQSIEE